MIKKLKEVAMDYMDKRKIVRYKSFENFLVAKKKSRIILMTTKAKKKYYNFNFKVPKTLYTFWKRKVREFQKMYMKMSYEKLRIPLNKKTRSLNISYSSRNNFIGIL